MKPISLIRLNGSAPALIEEAEKLSRSSRVKALLNAALEALEEDFILREEALDEVLDNPPER
jgi:uncharacterized protein (DUF1778 family)